MHRESRPDASSVLAGVKPAIRATFRRATAAAHRRRDFRFFTVFLRGGPREGETLSTTITTRTEASVARMRAAAGRLTAPRRGLSSSRPAGTGARRTRVSEMRLFPRIDRLLGGEDPIGSATTAMQRRRGGPQLRWSG
jgi:hypothetical protein